MKFVALLSVLLALGAAADRPSPTYARPRDRSVVRASLVHERSSAVIDLKRKVTKPSLGFMPLQASLPAARPGPPAHGTLHERPTATRRVCRQWRAPSLPPWPLLRALAESRERAADSGARLRRCLFSARCVVHGEF